MAIRTMKATLQEMKVRLDNEDVTEVGDNFRVKCDLLADFPLYLQWETTLPMSEPGTFVAPNAAAIDFHGTLRQTLQDDVDLTNCALLMNYGSLLDQTQDDRRILRMTPTDQATHVLLTIRWPVGKPLVYDTSLAGPFATKYGALAYQRHEPGARWSLAPDSYGADVWLLQMEKLGDDCRRAAIAYAEARALPSLGIWEDFDLRKAYYRQVFTQYEQDLSLMDIKLKCSEDYAELIVGEQTAEHLRQNGEELPRLWYNECHLRILEGLVQNIHEVIAISGLLAGSHSSFGGIVIPL